MSNSPNLCLFAPCLQNSPVKFLEFAHGYSVKLGITLISLLKAHSYKISFWNFKLYLAWRFYLGVICLDLCICRGCKTFFILKLSLK